MDCFQQAQSGTNDFFAIQIASMMDDLKVYYAIWDIKHTYLHTGKSKVLKLN